MIHSNHPNSRALNIHGNLVKNLTHFIIHRFFKQYT